MPLYAAYQILGFFVVVGLYKCSYCLYTQTAIYMYIYIYLVLGLKAKHEP